MTKYIKNICKKIKSNFIIYVQSGSNQDVPSLLTTSDAENLSYHPFNLNNE